jgi:hypothetical protein
MHILTHSPCAAARYSSPSSAHCLYGRLIGVPELKPHDLRHGVAVEVYEQHHDLEEVRALLAESHLTPTLFRQILGRIE